MKKTGIIIAGLIIALWTLSCKETSENLDDKQATIQANQEVGKVEYCFRNEFPFIDYEGKNAVDVEELRITVEGEKVEGTFDWIPAEKGGMRGIISGTIQDNTITAIYKEINSDGPIQLNITLSPDKADINSSDDNFGEYSIPKVDCW